MSYEHNTIPYTAIASAELNQTAVSAASSIGASAIGGEAAASYPSPVYAGKHRENAPMAHTPEQYLPDEALAEMSAEAAVSAYVWADSRGIPAEYGGGGGHHWQELYTRPYAQAAVRQETPPEIKAAFRDQGVSELLTVKNLGGKFSKVNQTSTRGAEDAVALSFETMSGSGMGRNRSEFEYFDAYGRPGNTLVMHVVLPRSLATSLLEGVAADAKLAAEGKRQDPDTIHRFIDQQMTGTGPGQFGMDPESWKKFRPPVEKWREQGGGVRKIAYRKGNLYAPPESGSIVTL